MNIDWSSSDFQTIKTTACCGNCCYYSFDFDLCTTDGEGANIGGWCKRYKMRNVIEGAPPLNKILIEESEREKRNDN